MRNLFLALVLANLGFAAWSAWFSSAANTAPRVVEDLPGITLVREVPADLRSSGVVIQAADSGAQPAAISEVAADVAVPTQPDPSEPAMLAAAPPEGVAPVAAPEPGTTCTSVGPFRELSQAASAAATLREAGHRPAQRVAEGDIWIGYWVYIPAIASEDEAEDILAKVRAEGISDSYIIPNSDSGSLVSLGVFSEISGVSRRRDQVRALGMEPEVVDRTRRATVYWVDVTLGAGRTLDFDSLQPTGRIIRLEQRACE
jgi:cell division septation protein DedD